MGDWVGIGCGIKRIVERVQKEQLSIDEYYRSKYGDEFFTIIDNPTEDQHSWIMDSHYLEKDLFRELCFFLDENLDDFTPKKEVSLPTYVDTD